MTYNFTDFVNSCVSAGIMPRNTSDMIQPSDNFKRIPNATDRGGKKSISYWLRHDYDYAYGYAHDFKTGFSCTWYSHRKDKSLSKADIDRIKAQIEERKKQEEIERQARYKKIAIRACQKLAMTSPNGSTPYLAAKKLQTLHGARIWPQSATLFIPLYDACDAVDPVSWQEIRPNGLKRFPFGGKKKGCFFTIRGNNDLIVICEGYATGCTIHEATGYTVIVAMDAYNLLPVTKTIRKHYKTTPVMIAADNDKSGTGQQKAAEVQAKVANVSVLVCPVEGCDFNDLGPDATKDAFGIKSDPAGGDVLLPGTGSQPAASGRDWTDNLILDAKNRIVNTSLQNVILYLINHYDFQGVFAYDEFRQNIIVKRCPPWMDEGEFSVHTITDIDGIMTAATLERYGFSCTIDKAERAISVAAWESRFNAAQDYLNKLPAWDGVLRIETMFQDIFGTTEESPEYLSFVGRKWLTAAVKRVMEPGCQFHHVLVLESQKEGLYKSSFFRELATFNGERYHTDGVSFFALDQKDTTDKMQGNIIIELAELTGKNTKDNNAIKNWLVQTHDETRLPWERRTKRFPRQFVFGGTTNEYEYLTRDERRFWPVTCNKSADMDYLRENKEQLWAEAIYYYRDGLYIGPTPEEEELARIERAKRETTDAWDDKVQNIIKNYIGNTPFRLNDILEKMDLRTNEKNNQAARRIASILKSNNFNNSPMRCKQSGKMVRMWRKVQD